MATDEKISVLYVDNEPSFLDIGKEYLEDTGLFIVDTASSAEEGIEKITHSRYDAIISDYQMRYLNGIEFLITIRKNSSIPFILLTGNNHENIIIDALNYGADYYLQKGEIPEKLFSELIIKIIRSVQRYRNKQDLIGESRVYAVKSAINAIIVRVDKRDELLRDVCRSFVEEGKFRAAWIGLQDPESIIRIVAINVLDDPDIDITNYNLLPDLNKELIQQSLTDGNHIILNSCDDSSSSDIHNSDQLLDRKYSTGLFPICLPTHVIGLFQIYAERNFFTENIGKILDEISLDISYAIEMISQPS